ncbi:MAG: Arc family DNA-binding protein [Pirellula sp.]
MSKRDSFLLRLRPEVMDALRRWADDEFRSVNGQIEFVLARALQQAGRLPASPAASPCDPPNAEPSPPGVANSPKGDLSPDPPSSDSA